MGYTGDKKLIYTKNKFETYLNTLSKEEAEFQQIDKKVISNNSTGLALGKFGTTMRKKDKEEFDRQYFMWLNTK